MQLRYNFLPMLIQDLRLAGKLSLITSVGWGP